MISSIYNKKTFRLDKNEGFLLSKKGTKKPMKLIIGFFYNYFATAFLAASAN